MKITVVEGTVEELREAFPNLVGETRLGAVHLQPTQDSAADAGDHAELQQWLGSRANTTYRRQVEWLVYALIANGLKLEIGFASKAPDERADYVRVHVPGTKDLPSVAYIYPRQARVHVRLPESATEGRDANVVQKRPVQDSDRFKVQVHVTSKDSAEVARQLVEQAAAIVRDEYGA